MRYCIFSMARHILSQGLNLKVQGAGRWNKKPCSSSPQLCLSNQGRLYTWVKAQSQSVPRQWLRYSGQWKEVKSINSNTIDLMFCIPVDKLRNAARGSLCVAATANITRCLAWEDSKPNANSLWWIRPWLACILRSRFDGFDVRESFAYISLHSILAPLIRFWLQPHVSKVPEFSLAQPEQNCLFAGQHDTS